MSWIVTEAPDRQLGAEDASRWERVVKGSSREARKQNRAKAAW